MPAPDGTPLVAHCKPPAAAQPPALQDRSTVLILHAMQEPMLTTTWNALRLPCSLWH